MKSRRNCPRLFPKLTTCDNFWDANGNSNNGLSDRLSISKNGGLANPLGKCTTHIETFEVHIECKVVCPLLSWFDVLFSGVSRRGPEFLFHSIITSLKYTPQNAKRTCLYIQSVIDKCATPKITLGK